VLSSEDEHLRPNVEAGEKSVLDGYGATNPAEFFAVAPKGLFERPFALK
jgi:Mlc titration factor MtfA (ptsG expression regulator)